MKRNQPTKIQQYCERETILDCYLSPYCSDRCADRIPFIVVEQSRICYHKKPKLKNKLSYFYVEKLVEFHYFFNKKPVY